MQTLNVPDSPVISLSPTPSGTAAKDRRKQQAIETKVRAPRKKKRTPRSTRRPQVTPTSRRKRARATSANPLADAFAKLMQKATRFLSRRGISKKALLGAVAIGWFSAHVVIELLAHAILGVPVFI